METLPNRQDIARRIINRLKHGRQNTVETSRSFPDIISSETPDVLIARGLCKFVHLPAGFLFPSDKIVLGDYRDTHAEIIRSVIASQIPGRQTTIKEVESLGFTNAGIISAHRNMSDRMVMVQGSGGLMHRYIDERGNVCKRPMLELYREYPDYAAYVADTTKALLQRNFPDKAIITA